MRHSDTFALLYKNSLNYNSCCVHKVSGADSLCCHCCRLKSALTNFLFLAQLFAVVCSDCMLLFFSKIFNVSCSTFFLKKSVNAGNNLTPKNWYRKFFTVYKKSLCLFLLLLFPLVLCAQLFVAQGTTLTVKNNALIYQKDSTAVFTENRKSATIYIVDGTLVKNIESVSGKVVFVSAGISRKAEPNNKSYTHHNKQNIESSPTVSTGKVSFIKELAAKDYYIRMQARNDVSLSSSNLVIKLIAAGFGKNSDIIPLQGTEKINRLYTDNQIRKNNNRYFITRSPPYR